MVVEEVVQIIWKMRDKLFRFSLKILDCKSEAEDVVQEVYFKVLNKQTDVEALKNPEAWCMTLTKKQGAKLKTLRLVFTKTVYFTSTAYLYAS